MVWGRKKEEKIDKDVQAYIAKQNAPPISVDAVLDSHEKALKELGRDFTKHLEEHKAEDFAPPKSEDSSDSTPQIDLSLIDAAIDNLSEFLTKYSVEEKDDDDK